MPHEQEPLGYYRRGRTTIYASRTDPRFGYCAYVPESYDPDRAEPYRVLALIHSTDRDAQYIRDEFSDLAERQDCLIFAPLFPAGSAILRTSTTTSSWSTEVSGSISSSWTCSKSSHPSTTRTGRSC